MTLKQKATEISPDAKKRKRVGFANIDPGIEANECIKVFLVKNQDEVDTVDGFLIDPIDLNHFFGEDGKIYGYKGLQVDIWLSCVSFLAYANIKFSSTSNGGKGITDLKPAFQNMFGESLVEREEFLQSFSTECDYIRTAVSNGTVISCDSSKEDSSMIEVIRTDLQTLPVGLLYSRLVPLVLLLVEGGSPIDVTDPRWEIYFVVKKMKEQSGDYTIDLLGFTTVYHFYHYPDSTRMRISQILILPTYQGKGHGRRLLESLNSVAVSENIYDVTVEEPSDYLQYLRACIDTLRLLALEPIKPEIDSAVSYLKGGSLSKRACQNNLWRGPPPSAIETARKELRINKKQLLRCWEILLYLGLDRPKKGRLMENFRACISDRLKGDILDKDAEAKGKQLVEVENDYGHDMTFAVFWSGQSEGVDGNPEGDQAIQEEQLNQLVDKEIEDVAEIAVKVSLLRNF